MKNTFDSTNTLKGIAILVVLINHYLSMNVEGNFDGFANLWIVIFFILSGYGIQYSLARHLQEDKQRRKNLTKFYYSRLIRIFPLFWMAYLIQCILFNKKISLWVLLGVHGPGHYWFIPEILQCYIISPIIFLLMRRNRIMTLSFLFLGFIAINFLLQFKMVSPELMKVLKYIHFYWRDIPSLHLLIFSVSMFLPRYISSWNEVSCTERKMIFFLLLSMTMVLMVSVRYGNYTPYLYFASIYTISPLIIISISSIYFISNKMHINYISWIGKISYSIYLFHAIFFRSINECFGFGKNSPIELFICMICFPVFLFFCYYLDKLGAKIASLQKKLPLKAQPSA